jgi:hypothetical protein
MKRCIRINMSDGSYIDMILSKAVSINSNGRTAIEIEKMSDETWRLTYSSKIIPDFTKVVNFEIVREP